MDKCIVSSSVLHWFLNTDYELCLFFKTKFEKELMLSLFKYYYRSQVSPAYQTISEILVGWANINRFIIYYLFYGIPDECICSSDTIDQYKLEVSGRVTMKFIVEIKIHHYWTATRDVCRYFKLLDLLCILSLIVFPGFVLWLLIPRKKYVLHFLSQQRRPLTSINWSDLRSDTYTIECRELLRRPLEPDNKHEREN